MEEISDDVLNAMHAAFDDVGVLPRDTGRISDVLKAPGREQNRVEWISNVVAGDRGE